MMLQNTTSLQTLILHHDLRWVDEHSWSPVVGNAEYSLTGALIIENGLRLAGQPITLEPPDDSMAWHTRAVVDQLYAWSKLPGQTFNLTLDNGQLYEVVFRHHEPPAMEAKPVANLASFVADDFWTIKLKFARI